MISKLMNGTLKKGQSLTLAAVGVLAGLGIATSPAEAATFTLKDGNSVADFNLGAGSDEQPSGLYNWFVEGLDQIFQESFFYRIGNSGPEFPVEELTLGNAVATDTNGDGENDNLFARFVHEQFFLDLSWRLLGGPIGSGTADIAETVAITNRTNSTLPISIFEYTDADLGGTDEGDTATLLNPTVFKQTDGGFQLLVSGIPQATAYEAAEYPVILDKLTDGDADDLNNTLNATNTDATFAWQWDFDIRREGTVLISKDKLIITESVPEPTTTLAFLALAPLALTTLKRKTHKPE